MTRLNFDATTVAPSAPMETLPAGKYLVSITKSEQKPTKAGNAFYLEFEFTVIDGEFRNRKVWDRLCLNHPKQITADIARSNLSAICHAVGVMNVVLSSELHNLPLVINVIAKKDSDGVLRNEVKGYAKYESRIASAQPPQHHVQTQVTVDNDSAPWEPEVAF